ncbi:MAG: hypothetical protein K6G12_01730 [Lachnospiraceae bacterium]|nr:hypothetical protein [Lachnospiraceae bacterium]
MSNEFNEALGRMTHEVASAGAIRHLAELGFSVSQIHDRLDYPTSEEKIRETLWRYYLDTGRIVLEDPGEGEAIRRTRSTFVKQTDRFGRTSYIKTGQPIEGDGLELGYVKCDLGLLKYRDPIKYKKCLESLSEGDRVYVSDINWPRQRIWHIADERMKRICQVMDSLKG